MKKIAKFTTLFTVLVVSAFLMSCDTSASTPEYKSKSVSKKIFYHITKDLSDRVGDIAQSEKSNSEKIKRNEEVLALILDRLGLEVVETDPCPLGIKLVEVKKTGNNKGERK